MAIIVDKDKKRKDIAFSVRELVLEKGIKKLTITEIAKQAGIARGSVYDYFETKEDIVFEIVMNEIEELQKELSKTSSLNLTSKQKIFKFFEFSLSEDKKYCQEREFYKEYLTVTLTSNTEKMASFNKEFTILVKDILTTIIQEGINKNELKTEALNFVDVFIAAEKGFLLEQWTEKRDIKDEFKNFINKLFDLIEKD